MSMWNSSNNSTVQNYATEADNTVPLWKNGQNCAPVMIGHLNRYGDELKIWGVPARMVTFVAIVDEVEVVSTRVNFKFRDETGSLKGLKWLDSETKSYESPVKKNSYARVYGTARTQQGENYVLVAYIEPLQNLNELLVHLMEVTKTCLEGEEFSIHSAQNHSTAFNSGSITNHNATTSAFDSGSIANHNATTSAFNSGSVANHNPVVSAESSNNNVAYNGLSREQALVMDLICRGDEEYGAERSHIKSHVPRDMVPRVDGILEFLSSEGHVYTTKSDNHFKAL